MKYFKHIKYLQALVTILIIAALTSCTLPYDKDVIKYEIGQTYIYSSGSDAAAIPVANSNDHKISAIIFDRTLVNESESNKKINLDYRGLSYSLTYAKTVKMKYNRYTFDIYSTEDHYGMEFRFANGKLVGLESTLTYEELLLGLSRPFIGDEALKARAREFVEEYSTPGYYKFCELNCSDNIALAMFYNEIDGYRAGDFACVTMLYDGTICNSYVMPDSEIYSVCKGDIDSEKCDAAAIEYLKMSYNRIYNYEGREIKVEYAGHELFDRVITLDDEGNPILIYYFRVDINLSGSEEETDSSCDFVDIVLELKAN